MTVSLSKRLLGIVDRSRKVNRAQFIREALAEKLASMGISIPGAALEVPDRVKNRLPGEVTRLNVCLNDEASTEPTPPAKKNITYPKPARKPRKPKV